MMKTSLAALCVSSALLVLLAVQLWLLLRATRVAALEHTRERRLREELEAYAQVDASPIHRGVSQADALDDSRALARRICTLIAEKSVFRRVAMLLRTPEGRLAAVSSAGIDDLTLDALHHWAEQAVVEERTQHSGQRSPHASAASFQINLGEWEHFDRELGTWAQSGREERRRWRRAVVAPIRTQGGRMAGALVVCADGPGLDGIHGWAVEGRASGLPPASLARAMRPIETLAARLATAIENETLRSRVLRAEKLAGLGQLAGGVAHALNNPLTAVLGFAELIAETTAEPRTQKDAQTILAEAIKMKETVARLVEFWRPSTRADETVDVAAILTELAAACTETLNARGVELILSGHQSTPPIRGSAARLRQVIEHLLNNAAQAIATARPREPAEGPHAIRLTVSHDEHALHLIVSDTGPGFIEPGRIFDPFYTTRGPEQGAGLGLSICYGIVREHNGEISAFNLHPHGAAVVVELPVGRLLETPVLLEDEPQAFPIPSMRTD